MDEESEDICFRTERQIIVEIIDMYKDLPCLWDLECNTGHNSLELLLTKWKTIDNNITLEVVKKKLENMRTTFFRELKKVEASKSSGAGAADVYKPSLWYYDHMMFLIENQKVKRQGVDSIETEDSFSEPERKSKKHKKQDLHNKQLQILESAEKLILNEEDPIESIARAIAVQLKEMSKLQRYIAEKLISEVIFYGKLEQLTVNSAINLNPNRPNQTTLTRRQIYVPMMSPVSPVSPASECRPIYEYTSSPSSHSVPSPLQPPATHNQRYDYPNEISPPGNENQAHSLHMPNEQPIIISPHETEIQIQSSQTPINRFSQQPNEQPIIISPHETEIQIQSSQTTINRFSQQPNEQPIIISPHETESQIHSSQTPINRFSQQPNVIYEGDRSILSDFLIFKKKTN